MGWVIVESATPCPNPPSESKEKPKQPGTIPDLKVYLSMTYLPSLQVPLSPCQSQSSTSLSSFKIGAIHSAAQGTFDYCKP